MNNSIGTVVQGKQILDLPLQARRALDFLSTVGGVAAGTDGSNINGNRAGAVNLTLDGLNVNENLVDGLTAVTNSAGFSVDRIEEIRVITSPADAELGRGSAQIQLISRGGTNVFHGSPFEENRNTLLTANNWFNNSHGVNPVTHEMVSPRPVLIRNQYGGRVGGPIVKNKTFFNFTYEGARRVSATPTNSVCTRKARGKAFSAISRVSATPTPLQPRPLTVVTTGGDPVQPDAATGPLQNVNVLTPRIQPEPWPHSSMSTCHCPTISWWAMDSTRPALRLMRRHAA